MRQKAEEIPVVRSTEIVMRDLADLRNRAARVWDYDPKLAISANLTNPTALVLEEKLTEMEKGSHTVAMQTGQAAIVTAILAAVRAGQRLLLPDSVYGPVRLLADNQLAALGIETDYYDPLDMAGLRAKIARDTALIYLESPGSLTFEVQDIAGAAALAKERGILTAMDNTWSTPLACNPLAHGVDMAIHSLSKLVAGQAEGFAGSVTFASQALYRDVKNMAAFLGHWLSPDDALRVLRGIESLPGRLEKQAVTAKELVAFLQSHPKAKQVFAPFAPESAQHALWRKYHAGHCGLFSVALDDALDDAQLDTFFKSLTTFKMSFGWGGPNSLIVPVRAARAIRPAPKNLIRIYTGMQPADILIADLQKALDSLP